ncbi:SRPBCC family protein [Capillimicrobium parvum]|uniref:Polyketide cyclase n=1 Tax=Capillimicrobium parvum TaxID=2884022 RepID=A0A9E6Y2K9_9ACTN|nr:SRPBCC family protein [Capillimicrobium parvum]UGS38860.1 hypothetical protein DSM104329_05291 [Capillimicrobium parvum]
MSHNTIVIEASAERVFAVLSDAFAYGQWVVGSETILDADPEFPATGSRFRHRVGSGPVKVRDYTEVVDGNPPYRLELLARARPLLGSAHVTMLVEPRGEASAFVTMIEHAATLPSRLVLNPLSDPLVHLRNAESLRRLKRLAEHGEAATATGPASAAAAGR